MDFDSLTLFAGYVEKLASGHPIRKQRALDQVGKLVVRAARAKMGVYQPSAGPFVAWQTLAQSTQNSRAELGFPSNQPMLRMRELGDSYTHSVESDGVSIGSPLPKARWLEQGTSHMTPRSVVGAALVENKEKIVNMLGAAVVRGLVPHMQDIGDSYEEL
jgi:hypothetical protein